ncbi:MAG: GNAT family N-acetyltransferase [Hyphomicrobiales bacterium]|nr:GNAT family N-acetyltransferase [Hyphomicrobiales bacterium]
MDEIITLRGAKITDCADLARLDNIASHGLSVWYWQTDHSFSQATNISEYDAIEIGSQRMANTDSQIGFKNGVIALSLNRVAGFATGFSWKQNNVATSKEQNPVLKPVSELFAQCQGGWWLDGLAVYPEFRGRGIGGKLLDDCFRRAKIEGKEKLCLAAEDSNEDALSLYHSRGFVECDRRDCFPYKPEITTKYWLLMEARVT